MTAGSVDFQCFDLQVWTTGAIRGVFGESRLWSTLFINLAMLTMAVQYVTTTLSFLNLSKCPLLFAALL